MILEEATTEAILNELSRRFDASCFFGRRLAVHEPHAAQLVFVSSGDPYLVIGMVITNIGRLQIEMNRDFTKGESENG